jgi:K+-transporting ATPase ATPase C chain
MNQANPQNFEPVQQSFGALLFDQIRISIISTIVLALIVCGIYPAIVWGFAQVLFPNAANGSLVKKDGTPTNNDAEAVGSTLLGQSFSDPKYFWPRPSAAGNGYDATSSGGSNYGPMSAKLLFGATQPATQPNQPPTVAYDGIELRVLLYCQANNIDILNPSIPLKNFQDDKGNYDQVKLITAFNDSDHPLTFQPAKPIPADAVTASASGLDPHISLENAAIQAPRVAAARKISIDQVKSLITKNTDGPDLGIFGDPGVNVLKLNIALDNLK